MKTILLLFIAYLLGSIPSGVWIGQLFFKKDIRQFGSGNTGTTNTFRVLGKSAGVIVLLMDILKGTLATCLPAIFSVTTINPLWFGVCAILGHTFPIFAKFKGGKAVATSAGMLLGYNPIFFFIYSALIFCDLFVHNQHGQPDKYDCSLLDHFVDNPIALCRTNDFTKTKLVIDVYRNWCHLFYFLSVIVKISSGSKTAQRAVSLLVLIKE